MTDLEFPRWVYRAQDKSIMKTGCERQLVEDQKGYQKAVKKGGWFGNPTEALEACGNNGKGKGAKKKALADMTREELEEIAKGLGITVTWNMKDATLIAKIEATSGG